MAMLAVVNAHQSLTMITIKKKKKKKSARTTTRKTVGIPPALSSAVNKIIPTDGTSSRRSRQDSAIGHDINILQPTTMMIRMTYPRIQRELGSERHAGQVVARLIPCQRTGSKRRRACAQSWLGRCVLQYLPYMGEPLKKYECKG